MRSLPALTGVFSLVLLCGTVRGQEQPAPARPGAMGVEEATTLTQGWAFLAQGDLGRAAQRAADALARSPRSAAALALAVEVEISRAGAVPAALDAYERWLGARAIEEPAVLRRIAFAFLKAVAGQAQNPTAQFDARRALADDGDAEVLAALVAEVMQGGTAEKRVLAARGDRRAVTALVADLNAGVPNALGTIQALGQSRSQLAVPALVAKLTDTRSEIRGAAADALGRIGGADVVQKLRPLLNDQSLYVKTWAASALYRLEDLSGLALLQQMAASESAQARLEAAAAMSSHPDAAWQALVRELATAPEADMRLGAAPLIATFDQALAAAVLHGLSADPNPAIREAAGRSLAAETTDLRSLRLLLRHADRLTRVAAAASVLRVLR